MEEKAKYETETKGHVWKTCGPNIDIFGYEAGEIHNGPVCINCGYGFCHHCEDVPEIECPNKKATAPKGRSEQDGIRR